MRSRYGVPHILTHAIPYGLATGGCCMAFNAVPLVCAAVWTAAVLLAFWWTPRYVVYRGPFAYNWRSCSAAFLPRRLPSWVISQSLLLLVAPYWRRVSLRLFSMNVGWRWLRCYDALRWTWRPALLLVVTGSLCRRVRFGWPTTHGVRAFAAAADAANASPLPLVVPNPTAAWKDDVTDCFTSRAFFTVRVTARITPHGFVGAVSTRTAFRGLLRGDRRYAAAALRTYPRGRRDVAHTLARLPLSLLQHSAVPFGHFCDLMRSWYARVAYTTAFRQLVHVIFADGAVPFSGALRTRQTDGGTLRLQRHS